MRDGVLIQPLGSRGYFMVPQAPEDAGYYVYGNVGGCQGPAIWRNTRIPCYCP